MTDSLFETSERRQFRDRRIPPALLPTLAKAKVRAIPEPYCVVSLPAAAAGALLKRLGKAKGLAFTSVTCDDRGVSAVLPAALWKELESDYPGAPIDRGYRVLAVEGDADWTTPGFLPVLGRSLAEGGISAGVLTGYRRLHLLVKARQVKETRVFLDLLSTQARGRLQGGGRTPRR